MLRGRPKMTEGRPGPLDLEAVSGILPRGGTILLHTSRTNPYTTEGGIEAVARKSFEQLDGLIAIVGEDTLGVVGGLHDEFGVPVVGVPKTIDNDIVGTTERSASIPPSSSRPTPSTAAHTAEAHERVLVVEVMGRYAGWIARHEGVAGGAERRHARLEPGHLLERIGQLLADAAEAHVPNASSSPIVVATSAAPASWVSGQPFADDDDREVPAAAVARADEVASRPRW